jgi:hypothetical protein
MALEKIVTNGVAVAGVHTLTLADVDGLYVGYQVKFAGCGVFDGVYVLTDVDATAKTVEYVQASHTHASTDLRGQASVIVSWADTDDVTTFLGVAGDVDWLEYCTDAANEFCWGRRQSANYHQDLPTVVPNSRVLEAVVLYAGSLYRERSSVDSYASFNELPISPPIGTMGRVKQLLGVERPSFA